jgi:hypothetical protein
MKKITIRILVFITCICAYPQFRLAPNGHVAIGIDWPNHSLHVKGYSQIFNFSDKEIRFIPNNNGQSYISSNTGKINFWHNDWGWNTLKAGAFTTASDRNMKKDTSVFNNPLHFITKLKPYRFKFLDTIMPDNKYHFGFMAQDVANVFPELVDTSMSGLTLNYVEIIPILTGAIKQMNSRIDSLVQAQNASSRFQNNMTTPQSNEVKNLVDSLNSVISDLKNKIENLSKNCCNVSNGIRQLYQQENNYIHEQDLVLQCIPNPFENRASIHYSVPEKYHQNLALNILSLNGELIKHISLSSNKGIVEVDLSEKKAGAYIYSVSYKNEIIISKILIIQR